MRTTIILLLFCVSACQKDNTSSKNEVEEKKEAQPVVNSAADILNAKASAPDLEDILAEGNTNLRTRLSTLSNLDVPFEPEVLAMLEDYLRNPSAGSSMKNNPAAEAAFRNAILNRLRAQNPQGLAELLVTIFHDREHQNDTIRDYSIQHLAEWYIKNIDDESDPEIMMVENTVLGALEETEGSIAATALLGLNRMKPYSPRIDDAELAHIAVSLVDDSDSSSLVVATALQIAAELGVREIEGYAREIYENADSVALKRAAKSALEMIHVE